MLACYRARGWSQPPAAEVQQRHGRLEHYLGARDAAQLLLVCRAQLLFAALTSRRLGLRPRRAFMRRAIAAHTLTSCA